LDTRAEEEDFFISSEARDDYAFDEYVRYHAWREPGKQTRALSFPQVKMCFEFKKRRDKIPSGIPQRYEKKDAPEDIAPQSHTKSNAGHEPGADLAPAASLARAPQTQTKIAKKPAPSSVPEHSRKLRSSTQLKSLTPLAPIATPSTGSKRGRESNAGEGPSSKKHRINDPDWSNLPGSVQSAIYATGKLSSSPSVDHTLNAVVEGKPSSSI
jgi:hypothetical protein